MIFLAGAIACGSQNSSTPADAPNGSGTPPADAPKQVDAPKPVDAPATPVVLGFACAGNTTPPTVPATVAVTGSAAGIDTNLGDLLNMKFVLPYTGTVDLCSAEPCTSTNQLGTATTTATGSFSFNLTTNAAPVPAYVEIPVAGTGSAATLETLAYIGTSFVKDTAVAPIVLVPQAAIAAVAQNAAGQCTTGAGLGFVAYKAVDCSGTVVTDSTKVQGTLTQNGTAVGDAPIDVYQTVTTLVDSNNLQSFAGSAANSLQGIFLVCGVPAGATTLNVTYASGSGNVDFLPVTFQTIGSAATEVAAQPGY